MLVTMYNGIEAAQVKGTGLSGYVQRSKATVTSQLSKFRPVDVDDTDGATPAESINPLLQKRSQKENEELARRLEVHKAIRAVRLRVLLYREEREAAGVPAGSVERECAELYRSLMEAVVEEQLSKKKSEDQKTAERFAAAFGVKTAAGGATSAFDRAKQEEERRETEEARRKQAEQQLAERLKRVRKDAAGEAE